MRAPPTKGAKMNHSNDNSPRLVSLNQVCELTSLSRTAVNKFRLRGEFPEEVNMGERRIAFVLAEVSEWIQARVNGRVNGGRKFKLPELKTARAA